ncbi:MAG: PhoX family phosphatase [Gammaproteobacteria bacterium]|nr:MAG: PhoX family phosphatase [Gammaproteobacteria bacterium]
MKGKKDAKDLSALIEIRLSRRQVMHYGLGSLLASAIPRMAFSKNHAIAEEQYFAPSLLGFKAVPTAHLVDDVVVPEGYRAEVFFRWGDDVSDEPRFKMDASNTAAEQMQQAGMHHDAIQFYPLPRGSDNAKHGLLVMNHEYIDAQLLHSDGGIFDSPENYTLEKTLKEQNAHGVSVIEVQQNEAGWQIVRPSNYARRITARTAMAVSGPVAGTKYLKTAADPLGQEILGTLNNCSNGKTPWGSYLTCEENFNNYFDTGLKTDFKRKQQKAWQRYGIKGSYYGWHKNDDRFDMSKHPNEANRFGWIVEFDPHDPESKPVKRTAMGRFAHENVAYNLGVDGRLGFYAGDDAKFEYVYKYITNKPWDGTQGMHHGQLLDDGILHVARFDEDGTGVWLPLVFGVGPLTQENDFEDQADVLVHARMAADAVGATPMDRPEWIATHPDSHDIYVSMTNNSKRGRDGEPDKDAANPRNDNDFGHIVRIVEDDATSTIFDWDIFILAGDKEHNTTINGDLYANPDGLMIDTRGVLWVQTDVSASKLNTDKFAQFGNNQMLAVDPNTGETRRFLTGPIGCEITGVTMTPDLKTMWVNIQHPGEVPEVLKRQGVKKSPSKPNAASNWPDHQKNGRPRSATVLITKNDGAVIGS